MSIIDTLLAIAAVVAVALLLARWYMTQLDGLDEWDGDFR